MKTKFFCMSDRLCSCPLSSSPSDHSSDLPSRAEPGPYAQPQPQPVSEAPHRNLQSLEQLLLRVLVLVKGDRQSLHLSAQPLLEMCLALQCGRLCP